MEFYHIKDSYINFLKQYDEKVPDNKNEKRPYVGVVFEVGGIKYYAPFSSPKPKHKNMKNGADFRKIAGGVYGAINFNNMIPVKDCALMRIDFKAIEDKKYRALLENQFRHIQKDFKNIKRIAENLRNILMKDESLLSSYELKVKNRCCDLKKLESVCDGIAPVS